MWVGRMLFRTVDYSTRRRTEGLQEMSITPSQTPTTPRKLQTPLLAQSDPTEFSVMVSNVRDQKSHPFLFRIPILRRHIPVHARRHHSTHQTRPNFPQFPLNAENGEQEAEGNIAAGEDPPQRRRGLRGKTPASGVLRR